MPIEQLPGGGTFITGQGIRTYGLLQCKSALWMFIKTGMRPNRHVNPVKLAQQVTGVTGRRYVQMMEKLDAMIAESRLKDLVDQDGGRHLVEVEDHMGYTAKTRELVAERAKK